MKKRRKDPVRTDSETGRTVGAPRSGQCEQTRRMDFPRLVELVRDADDAAKGYAVSAVNRALVVRNWLVGRYIVEFEQHGADRAAYGERLLKRLSAALAASSARGFSERSLELCRRFYLAIPEISQTTSAKLGPRSGDSISKTLSAKLPATTIPP